MRNITKAEAFYLREIGKGDKVHSTINRPKKYFVEERTKAEEALLKYRNEHIVKSF